MLQHFLLLGLISKFFNPLDPDPEGLPQCGSVRIRIRHTKHEKNKLLARTAKLKLKTRKKNVNNKSSNYHKQNKNKTKKNTNNVVGRQYISI